MPLLATGSLGVVFAEPPSGRLVRGLARKQLNGYPMGASRWDEPGRFGPSSGRQARTRVAAPPALLGVEFNHVDALGMNVLRRQRP